LRRLGDDEVFWELHVNSIALRIEGKSPAHLFMKFFIDRESLMSTATQIGPYLVFPSMSEIRRISTGVGMKRVRTPLPFRRRRISRRIWGINENTGLFSTAAQGPLSRQKVSWHSTSAQGPRQVTESPTVDKDWLKIWGEMERQLIFWLDGGSWDAAPRISWMREHKRSSAW